MFQVVSMVARPKPPALSSAAIGLPAFVSLYSTCWAAAPWERLTWLNIQVFWKVACNYFDRPNIDNVVKSVTTLRCGKSAVRLKGLRWNQRQCRATWVLNEVAQHLTIGSNNLPWRDSSIVDYLQLYNVYCILYYHSTTMYFHILCVIFVRNSLMVPWDQL